MRDWREDATCAGMPVDVFFPDPGDTRAERKAKEICTGCPVRMDCLEWAQDVERRHGIFAGMTPKQRKYLRDKAARK